ncbi:hypothetical protein LB506_010076 [Fusarium annulatum]|nr:hypothetical protein LB506_010076 [Fusarium annulatum]
MTLWNFAYSELVKKEWDDSRFSHRARYTFVYRSSNFLPLQKDFSPGALLSSWRKISLDFSIGRWAMRNGN